MIITLNIGLNVSKNYLHKGVEEMQLQFEYVKEYLEEHFDKPICIELAESAPEKTVVAQYTDVQAVLSKLYWLAHELGQDCIAYRIEYGVTVLGGALVGEYAHEWNYGIFNEAYFIEPTS